MKYICMLGTQGNLSQRNDSYLFIISANQLSPKMQMPYRAWKPSRMCILSYIPQDDLSFSCMIKN